MFAMQKISGQRLRQAQLKGILVQTPILEICVDSPAGVAAALAGGAERLELCSALALGGMTPSPGLVAAARASGLPIAAMVRPLAGGFVVDADELDAHLQDIRFLVKAGVDAIVCGALLPDSTLNRSALEAMVQAAGSIPLVLHRCIDLTPDWEKSLELAIELGIRRVLTSGGHGAAPQNIERISQMVSAAARRIEIMPGGGITPDDVASLAATGVDAIHGSASRSGGPHGAEPIGIPPYATTCPNRVRAMRAALSKHEAAA